MARAHQFLTFTTPPNLQHGVAYGLGKDDSYFEDLRSSMQTRRDLLIEGLREVGFAPASCQGTYFVNADYSPLGSELDDVEFCKHLTREAGVAAIPTSVFYQNDPGTRVVRFCFCKDEDTLREALSRLRAFFR
jgi:aspartate/methionine/tyrosine aminotransferase